MSIVLLMANKNEVFLCGDKRITTVKQAVDGKLTDYAYDDQGRKIYKINERVVIGAVGSVGIQKIFWEPAIRRGQINEDNQRCEYKDFVRCFDKRLHEVFKIVEAEHLPKTQAEFDFSELDTKALVHWKQKDWCLDWKHVHLLEPNLKYLYEKKQARFLV